MNGIRRRTWAQIDLDAAAENFKAVKQAADKAAVCCVIKANGYGHGAVQIGRLYEKLGADFLAVSNIEEALQLRRAGITLPVLILGYTPPECAALLSRHGISQCVYSYEYASALSAAALAEGSRVRVHIKIDTGMGRIGFDCREKDPFPEDAVAACQLSGLLPEGVFTHFASADEGEKGDGFTQAQFERFCKAADRIQAVCETRLIRHCANSAAIFDHKEYHLDMVRAGIVLYGLRPSCEMRSLPHLSPVMSLKSVVSHIKSIKKGDTVSYGRTFTADKDMPVATVPLGYADGFPRLAGGSYSMTVNGREVPIVGRVCMDQIMFDATGADVCVGDVVTVFGSETASSADSLASAADTINYEIVCAVGERVPRFFVSGGTVVEISDNLCNAEE